MENIRDEEIDELLLNLLEEEVEIEEEDEVKLAEIYKLAIRLIRLLEDLKLSLIHI